MAVSKIKGGVEAVDVSYVPSSGAAQVSHNYSYKDGNVVFLTFRQAKATPITCAQIDTKYAPEDEVYANCYNTGNGETIYAVVRPDGLIDVYAGRGVNY